MVSAKGTIFGEQQQEEQSRNSLELFA